MGDVRELLARMNTPAVRFDIGRGGIPELTPQDIAAALGMVPPGIGRDLLHWLHGSGRERPMMPERLPKHIDAQIAEMIADRRRDQLHRRADAQINLDLARELAAQHRNVPEEARCRVIRLSEDLARKRAACWPADSGVYAKLRAAVVHELDGADLCGECRGRGRLVAENLSVVCSTCNGSGRRRINRSARARMLGVDESTYRKCWARPFDYLFAELTDAYLQAIRGMREALEDRP